MSIIDEILGLYEARGSAVYFGERVSMIEHGQQAAYFAQMESAPEPLVIAALLHDVGHLLEAVPDAIEAWTSDARHEEIGARWLARRFAPGISEPVRLHVRAKRYLCASDERYFARLSTASVHTLKLQGGPMSAREVRDFENEAFHREALRVRLWDDQGKVAGLVTPQLRDYVKMIEQAVRA